MLGAIEVVQLDRSVDVPGYRCCSRKGVWLRPFRDLVYTMPPYICPDEDIARICMGVAAAVDAGTRPSHT